MQGTLWWMLKEVLIELLILWWLQCLADLLSQPAVLGSIVHSEKHESGPQWHKFGNIVSVGGVIQTPHVKG